MVSDPQLFSRLRNPDFSRLVTTLFGGRADAIPLIELGVHPIIKEALLGRPIRTVQDDVAFMSGMGYDFIKIQPSIEFRLNNRLAPSIVPGSTSVPPDRAWASEHSGVVTSWEEFERYPWPTAAEIDYSRFETIRKVLPEGMGVIGQYGDIFTVVWEMMGFETFAFAVYEQPDLVRALFQRVGELILSMYDTMASMDWVGALWFSDDIAYTGGTMLKPEFFREHFFPLLRRIGDRARARGIPFLYHSDGVLWTVMDDLVACGVNALHPIEPKSMNIREVQQRYGDRLSLCGGIDVDLLTRGTPDAVRRITRSFIADLGPRGGWSAGSSNSIPEYVPVANYVAMVETVLREGTFGPS
jgi:uroporphyrinogen decarboxylase